MIISCSFHDLINWYLQTKLLTEKMAGMDKDKFLEAVSQLKYEDEAYHERIIEKLIHEYDDCSASCEGDGTDSIESDGFNKLLTERNLGICLIDMENLDKKHAARKDPIKDTPTLKAPITESYLGKRLCQSESGPTDMRPVVTEPLAITENPFNTEPLTENSIVTELNVIGQGGSWAVIRGTHMITNPRQISLKGDSFPFDKEQVQTLMLTSLLEALLACNRNI